MYDAWLHYYDMIDATMDKSDRRRLLFLHKLLEWGKVYEANQSTKEADSSELTSEDCGIEGSEVY